MADNPIDQWYSSDENLKNIIDTLSFSGKSFFEQAKEAFYQISELYGLHKYPDEISEDDYKKYEEEGKGRKNRKEISRKKYKKIKTEYGSKNKSDWCQVRNHPWMGK